MILWVNGFNSVVVFLILSKNIGLEEAPTDFADLFYERRGWCQEQGLKPPDKKKTKEDLFKWQEKN